jgi:hypothetical protein
MVRQTHHERNQHLTVRPELVEGLVQDFLKSMFRVFLNLSLMFTEENNVLGLHFGFWFPLSETK